MPSGRQGVWLPRHPEGLTARSQGAWMKSRSAANSESLRPVMRSRVPLPEKAATEGPLSRLTPREREVLDQLATGATNKTIAGALVISEKTVSVHVSNILRKTGSRSRAKAAAHALRLS